MPKVVTPLANALPPASAIQDPAARTFATAVADMLRAAQSPEHAIRQLDAAFSRMASGGTPPSIAQWLFSSELYRSLSGGIEAVDLESKQQIAAEQQARILAIAAEAQARADDFMAEVQARNDAVAQEQAARSQALLAESEARSDGLLAEAQSRADEVGVERAARIAAITEETQARAADILAEATARGTAITVESTLRQNADSALAQTVTNLTTVVGGNTTAIQAEATARTNAISAEATLRETLAAEVQGNAASISTESTARADADSAESSARSALATQLRGAYTGTDVTLIQTGLIAGERTSRITADQALQQQINIISAASSGDVQDLMAAVSDESTARIAGDEAVASNVSLITSRLDNVSGAGGDPTNKTIEATLLEDRTARVNGDIAIANTLSLLSADVGDNAADIASEATARASADSALAGQITTLSGEVDDNRGLITSEATARANADGALAGQIDTVSAVANARNRTFSQSTAPTGAVAGDVWYDTSRDRRPYRYSGTAWVETSDTRVAANAAAIVSESTVRADADTALASQITSLTSVVEDVEASVVTESTARTTADEAIATQLTALNAEVDDNTAAIVTESTARADADTALATQFTVLNAEVDDNRALITAETTARANADSALASQITTLSATVDDNAAAIVAESTARADADTALATNITGLTATVGANTAAITAEQTARVDADTALTTSLGTQTSRIDTAEAGIVTEATTRATNDTALMQAINTAWSVTGATNALIQSGGVIQTNWSAAQANQWNALQAEVFGSGGNTIRAALAQEATLRANADGNLYGQYTVKVDLDGYVAGFGLASETSAAGAATSSFIIRADKFAVVAPGFGEHVPFAIGPSGASFVGAQNTTGVAQPFAGWDIGAHTLVSLTDGKVGGTALRLGSANSYATQKAYVPIDPTKQYRTRFWARPSSTCDAWLDFTLRQAVNETGTWGPISFGRSPIKPGYLTRALHNHGAGADGWREYTALWDLTDWQAGVKFFRPEFHIYKPTYLGLDITGHWDIQGLVIEEATDVEAAKTAASTAQGSAATANNLLTDIASDSKLTASEKQQTKLEWDGIVAEKAGINAQAAAYSITTENTNYNNAYNTLSTYITPLLSSLTTTSDITGGTFRANFSNLYSTRQALLNRIAAVAGERATWATVTGSGKPANNADVTSANTAAGIAGQGAFATLSQITSSNITTYIADAAIGSAQIGSINLVGTSNFAVKSATAGARMDMDSRRIKVFDTNGVLRVQLGNLSV